MNWHRRYPDWPNSTLQSAEVVDKLTVHACPYCGLWLRGEYALVVGHIKAVHPGKKEQVLIYPPSLTVVGSGYDC